MVRVLLVEDNPFDVLLIREAMRRSNIPVEVANAADGEEAVELMKSTSFDLIILDLNLPKLSGHEVLEQAQREGGPPVVVFSGSDKISDRQKALALGAEDYVVKPRTYEEFLKAVQEIIQGWTPHLMSGIGI